MCYTLLIQGDINPPERCLISMLECSRITQQWWHESLDYCVVTQLLAKRGNMTVYDFMGVLFWDAFRSPFGFIECCNWLFGVFSICITHLLFMEVISVQRAFIDDFLTHRPSINLSRTYLELMFLHLCSGD